MRPKIYTALTGAMAVFSLLQSNAQTNKTLSNLTAPTAINQSLLPNTDSSKDLGSSAKAWRSLYLSHSIYLQDSLALHATGTNNIFLGSSAGNSLVTGWNNVGLGKNALRNITYGSGNNAGGYNALYKNTSGSYNNAFGYHALYNNTTGQQNIAEGFNALYYNTSGSYNTATGSWSLYFNATGSQNTAAGSSALMSNSTGNGNTAFGISALRNNTKGHSNVAIGTGTLRKSVKNSNLVAVGDSALHNFEGQSYDTYGYNTAVGSKALFAATTGFSNTALGFRALHNTTKGWANTATGEGALVLNTEGAYNTGAGSRALNYNTTGSYNTAIGYGSMNINKTGSYNTALGTYAGFNFYDGINNSTAIGYMAQATASNQVRIGNTAVTSIGGQVGWTIFSDGRFKTNIKEDVSGLAFINSLRPVTYKVEVTRLNAHLNKKSEGMVSGTGKREDAESALMDGALQKAEGIVHTGFVAQEVEAAANKIGYQFDGVDKPEKEDGLYGLRYDHFVAPLVKAVQELSKQNEELKKELDALKALVVKGTPPSLNQPTTITTSTALEQNVPNPFNHTTVIQYTLPQTFTNAQLVITDTNGRTIKKIHVSGTGKGSIQVDAATLASGAYQYSLIVDGKPLGVKQMVVTK